MLTYLDRAAAVDGAQRAQRLMRVTVACTRALSVEAAARLAPGEVVHHRQLAAPENGGAVWHRQHTRVDKAC